MPRRTFVAALLTFAASRALAAGDDVSVPFPLQARLLGKVLGYDKNLRARAGERVRVLIVRKSGDGRSERAAKQLQKALEELDDLGGLSHDERIITYGGADALKTEIKKTRVAIVYLMPGLSDQTATLAKTLRGVDVLTVTAVADDVARRIVLGFGVVSGKPKIFCHLDQARLQHVDFEPRALKLMTVYR